MGGPIPECPYKDGSKLARIDDHLRREPLHWEHGPQALSEILTILWADGTIVTKQEVWQVLHDWGHTRKKCAVVPARSHHHERVAHVRILTSLRMPGQDHMV